ncbi:MAG: Rv3235 family protein [Actinomycetota bacterium]|nr:Rv3235 family protein [Actinomycetota bacterium]
MTLTALDRDVIPIGRLALRAVPSGQPPFDDERSRHLRLVPAIPSEDVLPFEEARSADESHPRWADDTFDRQPTSRAQLPDPRPWAARLVVATMEVLSGRRPLQQLMPWTDDAVYMQISRALPHRRAAGNVARLRSLHISEPADGVAEVCAVVAGAERSRAVAARLEGVDGRWRCTALQLG